MGQIDFKSMRFQGERIRVANLGEDFYALSDAAKAVQANRQTLRNHIENKDVRLVRWWETSKELLFVRSSALVEVLRYLRSNVSLQLAAELELRKFGVAESQKMDDDQFASAGLVPSQETSVSPFDSIKQVDEDGTEFWSARDLMPLMGYTEWRKFSGSIDRAKASAEAQGMADGNHFVGADKVIQGGRWGHQTVEDFHLTRFAAYLVAMNGDPRKSEVAAAQSYFAVNTYENEQRKAEPQFEIPQTYAAALRAAADATDRADVAEKKVTELEPRAKSYDRFMNDGDHLMSWDRVARILGVGRNKLLHDLREDGVLMKGVRGETWNIPFQRYQHHFDLKVKEITTRRGDEITATKVRVKPSGVDFISKRLGLEEVAA